VVCFESLYEKDIEVALHADLEDHEQSVYYPAIRTSASISGNKSAVAKGKVTLEDKVEYSNLIPGTEYELKGILMDKKTGKPLSVRGEQVMASARFTAEDAEGTIPVIFTFDADGLGEKTLVVFETLYAEGIEVCAHADLKDEEQTVRLNPPSTPPKTGDGAKTILWSLAALSGLAGAAALLKIRRKRNRQ
jgi:LPXTG-motif cell wall-anchored protein